ncbi:hypothetical protein UAJ10_28740 [Nitrospirillum sp. BR 11164]|uniref:hypothetical protein n=1 Tax=Nitrospirillum sp. BR 11164 TaxID=3104324 RepID=UPI002AFED281|nr:hypothetical protein [Nitrospirillum sp. BR 11164]MEA1652990.1 hypothetical protein [Nitrospirillum sp. BR 11164]
MSMDDLPIYGAIYSPPSEGLPFVAAIFKGHALMAFKQASSAADAEAMLAHAVSSVIRLEAEGDPEEPSGPESPTP